jgi:import inner membrane translocase subunit TIM22
MSATFAYEDPLSRASEKLVGTKAQTMFIFKEMGRNMWSSGKGFAKVGALYSGYECCIEGVSPESQGHALCRHLLTIFSLTTHPSVMPTTHSLPFHTQFRAKNDIYNSVAGGFLAGATLSRSGGIKAAIGGGAAFAAFSAVIDLWIRKQPAE